MHDAVRSGDVLAVWRLDRLGRSLKHLIELMAELEAERIGFQSVTESIDTTTPGGKLVFQIFGRSRNLSVTSSARKPTVRRFDRSDRSRQVCPESGLAVPPG